MRGLDARRRHDGVDLPRLTIAVSRGDKLPAETAVGQPGVRTRGSLALMLGAAERVRQSPRRARRAPGRLHRPRTNARQQRGADPLRRIRNRACRSSWAQQPLARPSRARGLATAAVNDYALTPAAINAIREVANIVARSEHANRGTSC